MAGGVSTVVVVEVVRFVGLCVFVHFWEVDVLEI